MSEYDLLAFYVDVCYNRSKSAQLVSKQVFIVKLYSNIFREGNYLTIMTKNHDPGASKNNRLPKIIAGIMAGLALAGCSSVEAAPEPTPSTSPSSTYKQPEKLPQADPKPFIPGYSPVDPYSGYERTPEELTELQEMAIAYREKFPESDIAPLRISAELDDQEVAEKTTELLDRWWNAGLNDDPQFLEKAAILYGTWRKNSGEVGDWLAQDNGFKYMSVLYGPDWTRNPKAIEQFDRGLEANSNTINTATIGLSNSDYSKLDDTDVRRIEYRVYPQLEGFATAEASEDGSRTLLITMSAEDTRRQLGLQEANIGRRELFHGEHATYRITYENVGGSLIITNFDIIQPLS